jgi:hypothetical protein
MVVIDAVGNGDELNGRFKVVLDFLKQRLLIVPGEIEADHYFRY